MKKGFTLIELLAVIVILAIIALISVPMILNVVEKSKEGSAKVSAENYLDAVEKYIAIEEIENKEIKIEKNKIYKVEEETNYEIEGEVDNTLYLNNVVKIKGDYPVDGYIKIEEKITYAEFTINNYLIECNESGICEVVGNLGKIIEAESIEINEINESELSIGKEIQLKATILPKTTTNKKVEWTSSNENVATISASGLLKIIGYGEVTITAKTKNNKISEKNIDIHLRIKEIAAGNSHRMAIDENGNLWTWGLNQYGQLGNNSTTNSLVPIQIMNGTKFKKIAAGDQHSLAIDESGNLWAWGWNSDGQLGNNSKTNSLVPIQIKYGTKFKEISAGERHNLAIDESGNLWSWGNNGFGRLFTGNTVNSLVPQMVMTDTKFQAISAGYEHSLAIDESGKLWGCGSNYQKQLSNGTTQSSSTTPIILIQWLNAKSISTFASHNLVLDQNGNLLAWGYNSQGQLGNGTSANNISNPYNVNSGTKFEYISAGHDHSLAIDESGNLWSWGLNSSGQLGNGTTTDSLTPIKIETSVKFKSIQASILHSLALDTEGNVWAWGNGGEGRLGNGLQNYVFVPSKIKFNS